MVFYGDFMVYKMCEEKPKKKIMLQFSQNLHAVVSFLNITL